jgi:hypothetical protein
MVSVSFSEIEARMINLDAPVITTTELGMAEKTRSLTMSFRTAYRMRTLKESRLRLPCTPEPRSDLFILYLMVKLFG